MNPQAKAASANSSATSQSRLVLFVRLALTALLVGAYHYGRDSFGRWTGGLLDLSTSRVIAGTLLLAALIFIWRKVVLPDPRFHGPMLITAILLLGDAKFNFLENHTAPLWLIESSGGRFTEYSPTFVTILATLLAEIILGRFFWGKWPHLASAYISGISAGILIKSPELWPFVLCGIISIMSKYVLRVGGRHIWNPTNFGVTMMLLLAPDYVASLSVQAGNNGWAVAIIWLLGGLILWRLRLVHIPLAFVASFIPLAFLRSWFTGDPWQTEIAPITSPMFQLYIFFMITDPKTITKRRWSQVLVAVLVACMETFLRLVFKDIFSLYHALFIVGPAANLIEIGVGKWRAKAASQTVATAAPPLAPTLLTAPEAGPVVEGRADTAATSAAVGADERL
jgi:hypothetical protein